MLYIMACNGIYPIFHSADVKYCRIVYSVVSKVSQVLTEGLIFFSNTSLSSISVDGDDQLQVDLSMTITVCTN